MKTNNHDNKILPHVFRLLQRKIENIKRLEKEYWKYINEKKDELSNISPEYARSIEEFFPPNQSSLIYACIDGIVLVRHSEYKDKNRVELKMVNLHLEKLLEELPIPHGDGWFNFSAIAKFGPHGGTIKIGLAKTNAFTLENIQVTTFKYSDEKRLEEWEDSVTDFKLALLGLNVKIVRENESRPENEKISIIQKLKVLKYRFDILLGDASKEEELQIFIKKHPLILNPYSTLISKQKLGSEFVTDFVLVNNLDQGLKYTLVEIERVSMPIFTEKGEFTAEFKHAENQTLDWDYWLEQNIDYLRKQLIGLESPEFIIVAGNSSKFTDENKAKIRTWNRRQNNTKFFTYNDLAIKLGELISSLEHEEIKHAQQV